MNFNTQAILKRVRGLIQQDTEESLRYACLELRFCIERIVYDKIYTYRKRIPEELFDVWQPKKVLKLLLEFEPDSEREYHIGIQVTKDETLPPGKPIRIPHKAITFNHINKHYDKLGNFLHVPTIRQRQQQKEIPHEKLRVYLSEVLEMLEGVSGEMLNANFAVVVNFKCSECHTLIIRNRDGLKHDGCVVCPECKAQYIWKKLEDDIWETELRTVRFICSACHTENFLEYHRLKPDMRVVCVKCHRKFLLNHYRWAICEIE